MVFESYGDESGTDDLSRYTSFGGYIGEKNQWKLFSEEWLIALKELNLGELCPSLEIEFHTGKFYALAKKARWPDASIDACVTRLAKIIKRRTLVGFGALILTDNYQAAFSPRIRKKRLKDRYYLLFEQALKMQWRYFYFGRHLPNPSVAFFFDEKPGFQDRALRIFDGLKKALDTRDFFTSRRFVSSAQFPPIQAADFIAFELRYYGLHGAHLSENVTTAMNALKRDLLVSEFHRDQLAMISKRLEAQMRKAHTAGGRFTQVKQGR